MIIKLTKKYVLEFTFTCSIKHSWYQEIVEMLKKGHLVAPVKLYQEHHKDATLGEAKKYVEDLKEKLKIPYYE